MNESQKVLSKVVIFNKYAKYLPVLQRRETWEEIIDRYLRMMIDKYGTPNDLLLFDYKESNFNTTEFSPIAREIVLNGAYLYRKDVLPSMRAAQFAGQAISKNNARIYNCAFLPIDNKAAFSEVMFLLLGGTGVGYSVQFSHVNKLPEINKGNNKQKFLVGDSIEGWADSIKALMYWAFGFRKSQPIFDYSDIREKGALLVTAGGKAPGPAPLRLLHTQILNILENKKNGEKLTTLEVHDIICYIADAVLAGGIRRAALIALFSADDDEMMNCKEGSWWESNPQRGRANNSAVLLRHRVTKEFFDQMWARISNSFSGEPGLYFSNDLNWGTNPCVEIALRAFQFCNLTEINAGSIRESLKDRIFFLQSHPPGGSFGKPSDKAIQQVEDSINQLMQEEFNNRARVAAFFGTLQAGFTDFHYLRDIWKQTTEKDSLVGVGMTGIASGDTFNLNLTEASDVAIQENKRVSLLIGINKAARVTTIKPSGTTSIVVGSSSGIHAWHSEYYIRNMQVARDSDIANYFFLHHPRLIKVMELDKKSAVIGIPQKAPDGAVFREHENAVQMLSRVFKYYDEWVKPGHDSGSNTNNVSATVSVKKTPLFELDDKGEQTDKIVLDDKGQPVYIVNEWPEVGEVLWNNRDKFNGMSVLPYDGGNYKNAPFETITKEQYEELLPFTTGIDLTQIREEADNTTLNAELACAGDNCEVK
jgi:ribonucleoside-triphosphate reductase